MMPPELTLQLTGTIKPILKTHCGRRWQKLQRFAATGQMSASELLSRWIIDACYPEISKFMAVGYRNDQGTDYQPPKSGWKVEERIEVVLRSCCEGTSAWNEFTEHASAFGIPAIDVLALRLSQLFDGAVVNESDARSDAQTYTV